MTTSDEDRERDFLARCVADAYPILDIIPRRETERSCRKIRGAHLTVRAHN